MRTVDNATRLLATVPDALVRADARPPALLAFAPSALVLADARAPALLEALLECIRSSGRTLCDALLESSGNGVSRIFLKVFGTAGF
jgi:hypothetical protein